MQRSRCEVLSVSQIRMVMREQHLVVGSADDVVPYQEARFNRERLAPTRRKLYIRSMIVFSVALGRITVKHFSWSGK
jgi:hypothetical protein